MSTKPAATPEGRLPVAGWGIRFGALIIDWIAATLAVIAVFGYHRYSTSNVGRLGPLLVFFGEVLILTVLAGGSFGQLALKLRVLHIDGSRLNPWDVLIRTVLICLVIPPLVYKPDGRGLHDMAVNSCVRRLG